MSNPTLDEVFKSLKSKQSFLVEAGAGAGKTTALIATISHILRMEDQALISNNQKVACITYTKRAVENITEKIKDNSLVVVSTIHAFFWSVINQFQIELKKNILESESWRKRWESKYKEDSPITWDLEGIKDYRVIYTDVAARIINFDSKELILHHDDILEFTVVLLDYQKFRNILSGRYPYILIDEYQDMKLKLAEKIICCLELKDKSMPIFGFYGDAWQKIYSDGIGEITSPCIMKILKLENFRSTINIVKVLNNIREEFPQACQRPEHGAVSVIHTNDFGIRRTESHWKGDLEEAQAIDVIDSVKLSLGWDFNEIDNQTGKPINKVLYLTHGLISRDINYRGLLDSFDRNESLVEVKHPVISFFVEVLEPIYQAYIDRNYSEILRLNKNKYLSSHQDKREWKNFFEELQKVRQKGSISQVIEFIKTSNRIVLPDKIDILYENIKGKEQEKITEKKDLEYYRLQQRPYSEIINFLDFINDNTVLSTQHGVKGEEYNNVLIIFGGGWNQYNWDNFLKWSHSNIPAGKKDAYIKNRNLFYVSCSRAKDRLVLLFTQELSKESLEIIEKWFYPNNIIKWNKS